MLPIFEQIGQVVNDFSVELANAHQIVDDTRLNQALEGVNEAVLMGIRVAQDVCDDIVDGRATEPNPIPAVQRVMYEKAAEATASRVGPACAPGSTTQQRVGLRRFAEAGRRRGQRLSALSRSSPIPTSTSTVSGARIWVIPWSSCRRSRRSRACTTPWVMLHNRPAMLDSPSSRMRPAAIIRRTTVKQRFERHREFGTGRWLCR